MKNLILILQMALLSACAKPNQTTPNVSSRDSMNWQATNPWWATNIDLNINGVQVVKWVMAYDQTCESAVHLDRSTMTIALSEQTSAALLTDAPCTMFDGSWTYSAISNQLEICKNGSCVDFK